MRQQTLLFANSLAPRIPRKRKYEDALTKTTEYLHNGQVVRRYVDPTRMLFARPGKRRMPALLENNYNPDEDEDIPSDLPPLPVAPPPQPVAPPPQPVPAPPANTDVGHPAEGGNGMGQRIGEAIVTGVTGVVSYAGNTALNMAERAGNAAADVAYQGAAGFARGIGEGAGQRIGYAMPGVAGMIGAGLYARAAYNQYGRPAGPGDMEPYQRPDTPRVPGSLPELYDHNLRPPGVQATLGEYDRHLRDYPRIEPYDDALSRSRRPPEVQRTLDEYERHQREYPQIAELPFHPDNDNGGEGSSTGARPARARLGEGLNALPFAREAEVDAPGGFRQLDPLRMLSIDQLRAMDTPEATREMLHRAGLRTSAEIDRDVAMARADRAAGRQGPQVGWWNTYEQLENMGAEGAAELQRRVEQGFGENIMPGDAANFDPFRIPRQVGQWGSQLFGGQRGGNIGFGLD